MNTHLLASCAVTLLFASAPVGCGGGVGESANDVTSVEQIAAGKETFAADCAKCHGAEGHGTATAPPLVGKDALPLDPRPGARLRKTHFHTGKDVLDFIRVYMPLDQPGALSEDQYDAVLAFALQANGVDLHGMQVSAASASSFVLH